MELLFYLEGETERPMILRPVRLPPIDIAPEIYYLLKTKGCPVAIGVSGGKDSSATAFATVAYLDGIGHTGPRILIHSDLGRVEWKDSLPSCMRLAERLGMEMVVVRRQAGDLMDRWLVRWQNNVQRYINLECVKLILPWSTASLRFCTSELKTDIICRELVQRFPGKIVGNFSQEIVGNIMGEAEPMPILSILGMRREESPRRAKLPIFKPQLKLQSKTYETYGFDWHPILEWTVNDVLACHAYYNFPLHEAYTSYGSSRVSCCFCILASLHDLQAGTLAPENHDIYREMVSLEIVSTFRLQSDQWLGDIAPHLLDAQMLEGLRWAKERAALREAAEARIPPHLLFTKGWPQIMPTWDEAKLIGEVRASVGAVVGIPVNYTEPDAVGQRYAELIALKNAAQSTIRR